MSGRRVMTSGQSAILGSLLRNARRDAELTQEELAERAGVSARGVSDLERGIIRAPRRDTLDLLMAALDLSAGERAAWRELREEIARRPETSVSSQKKPASSVFHRSVLSRTPLVGREREIAEVVDLILLDDVPLVTLTGPGGVGKTRLALSAADVLKADFPAEVCSISLAPLNTFELVIPTIAAAFNVTEKAGRPLAELLGSKLGQRRVLIVLDNCEHVISAATELGNLMAACPNLKILATSRVPLHVYGEREYRVSPLRLPDADRSLTVEQLAGIESIELFVQRTGAVRPGFELTTGNTRDVAAICRKLDGLPLAIELAAVRMRVFSPQDLLARLDQPLDVLAGGPRDVPARQQALRNTIAWSYDLLGADEQRLFRQLAVFRGGWTLAAVSVVAGLDIDVVSALETLVEHNLVHVREQADEVRYGMLETIREFVIEQLEAHGESEQAVQRHTEYYVDLVERARSGAGPGAGQQAWWDHFQQEMDNIREVLGRAINRGDSETALRLSGALRNFWFHGGHYYEARYWLESALALDTAAPADVHARAYVSLGHTVRQLGDMELATRCAARALDLYAQTDDRAGHVEALILTGWVANYRCDYDSALHWAERALIGARATGDKHILASALDTLGMANYGNFEHELAKCLFAESLALYREVGDFRNVCRLLGFLGYAALVQGHVGRAEDLLAEALDQADRVGDIDQFTFVLGLQGWLDIERTDYRSAYAKFVDTLPVLSREGSMVSLGWTLEGMAACALELGDPLHAARLTGAVEALNERIESSVAPWRRDRFNRVRAAARHSVGGEAFEAADNEARSWTLVQTIEYALEPFEPAGAIDERLNILTHREIEVLRLLVDGRSNQGIAEELSISPHTAVRHVASIMNKLMVDSRTAAATWALRNGIA